MTQNWMFSMVGRIAAAAACLALLVGLSAPRVHAAAGTVVVVHLKLDRNSKLTHLDAGDSVGVSPATVRVHVGDAIVFQNDDPAIAHTATGLPNATRFVEPRWTDAMLKPVGTIGADAWSTGTLAPGAKSAPLTLAAPGTFLYGCFFHYSAGMRGQIIVEP